MKACALFLLLLALSLPRGPASEPAPRPTITRNGQTFTLPAGFTLELVAGPPLVERPIAADFDDQGRLYVTEASGTNAPVQEQLRLRPHRVLRLEDTDGDGKFDKRTVFADKLMLPQGVLWHEGALFVATPPSIWKLTDTDGDGVADQRVEWFQGKTLTGCANDLHGPYRGPDGWLYWCKGAFAQQTYERPGKPPFVTRAAHIFRARPDGSGLEQVMTGGMDNPVEVAFLPSGERFFTTTFLQHPAGGKRDGLLHAVYGGLYGKDHDPIYSHPWTGPTLMPVMTHLGAAAPSGLTCYQSTSFGPTYQGNLFAALFNLRKVTRHVLVPRGATFTTRDEDFLVSSNLDFHPTDVLEDADGSLLVVDTGGWYKLCCPTSQLHKPDVLGAIYRIRKTGAAKVDDPRGLKLAWGKMSPVELASLLGEPRPAVSARATRQLAQQGEAALTALQAVLNFSPSAVARTQAVWVATQIPGAAARHAVRAALRDSDATVRQAALHNVSLWRDADALPELSILLRLSAPAEQRLAAEDLGRIGNPQAIPALLSVAGGTTDRVLEHAAIYALIEIAHPEETRRGLTDRNPRVRRAALIALDQMPGGKIPPEPVLQDLSALNPALQEAAWWIVSRHPEWGGKLTAALRQRLADPTAQSDLLRYLPGLVRSPAVQDLLAEVLTEAASSRLTQKVALLVMAQSGLKKIPPSWVAAVQKALGSADVELLTQALRTVRAWPLSREQAAPLTPRLVQLGREENLPVLLRLQALAALPGGVTEMETALFFWLCHHVRAEQPAAQRTLAAEVLGRSRLTSPQLLALAEQLRTLGPMELDRVLYAFAATRDETVVLWLLHVLRENANARVDTLKTVLAKQGPRVQQEATKLYALLQVDAAQQQARLEQLLASLPQGDIRRGQTIFHGTKTACSSCHALGYLGGNVGPDLTHIGRIRSERDLLEAVVFPSASFVRSYEPVVVLTKDGKLHTGVLRKEAAEEIVLAISADQEVRLPRGEIEEMKPGQVSIMPSGLDQQMTPQELADLLAFLKACK